MNPRWICAVVTFLIACSALAAPVAASGVESQAMGGAGVAGASGLSALFLNPASAATLSHTTGHAGLQVTGAGTGPLQLFAYGEPDRGKGAGVLGYVRLQHVDGYDAIKDEPAYQRSGDWVYAVAKELLPGSIGGARIAYSRIDRDLPPHQGWGYRLDLGATQSLGGNVRVGLLINGLWSTGIHWSDGTKSEPPRTLAVGAAANVGPVTLLADAWSIGAESPASLRLGAKWARQPFVVMGGLVSRGGSAWTWSGGATWRTGAWQLEYAYTEEGSSHRLGITITM